MLLLLSVVSASLAAGPLAAGPLAANPLAAGPLAAGPLAADPVGPTARQLAQYGHLPIVLPGSAPRATAVAPPSTSGPAVTVYGFHAYWSADPTALDFERLTHLALFNVDLNADGSLDDTERWTDVAGDVVPVAHGYGVRVHLCVTAFDDDAQTAVFNDPALRATAIANMKALVDDYGADGVMIDIEAMDGANREGYATFVEELAVAVDDVFLSTPSVDWTGAFDYARLAAATQGMFIMAYNYYWSGGDPGPNNPLYGDAPWGPYAIDWSVDDYLASGAPADKLILGLPLYGWEWPTDGASVPGNSTGTAQSVFMEEAVALAAAEGSLYDTSSHSPYLLRADSQVWYSDTSSIQERIAWAVGNRMQGVGFWALGYEGEDPAFWEMVAVETAEDKLPEPEDTGSGDSGGDGGGDSGTVDTGAGDTGTVDTGGPEDSGDDTETPDDTDDTDDTDADDTDADDTAVADSPRNGERPGKAVDMEASGGCGCTTGTAGAGGGLATIGLIGAAILGRRRKQA